MLKPGHVRLIAAMFAAISLHALLFKLLPSSHHSLTRLTPENTLQLELLAKHQRPVSSAAEAKKEAVTVAADNTPTIRTHQQIQKQKSRATPPPQASVIATAKPQAVEPQAPPTSKIIMPVEAQPMARKQTKEFASAMPEHVTDRAAVSHTVAVVPQNMHQYILANVHYPRQARRHGWQGRAEFQLDVNQQMIHAITLLASSGHPILDRAARRGLTSVQSIPLSNGLYRIPVVFQLQ